MKSILIHQGLEIADSYTVQAEEDKLLVSNNLIREVYFDSADVIQLIQGAWAIYQNHFDKEEFDDPTSLIIGFAFNGWLGPIHLLPPHQDELIDKLMKESFLFPSAYPLGISPANVTKDILYALNLEELAVERSREDRNKIQDYTRKLKDNAQNLFKLDQLLNKFYWTDRYKYLFNPDNPNNIVIDNHGYEVQKITKTKLFKTLREAFDEVRDTLPKNNIIDALAFCLLQDKLNAHKENPAENPLPVFFVSKKSTFKALKKVMAQNKGWFTYKHGDDTISILRDPDFFILDAIFSPKNMIRDLDSVLRKIKEIKDNLKIEYDRYTIIKRVMGRDEYDQFSNKINQVVDVDFFRQVWLEDDKYQQIDLLIREYIQYDEDVNAKVAAVIRQERKDILKTLTSTLPRIRSNYQKFDLLKQSIDELYAIKATIKKQQLTTEERIDIFRDFALVRFSLDGDTWQEKIQKKVIDIIEAVNNEEESRFNQIISEIASSLVSSAFGEQNIETVVNLGALWVFDQHRLISKVCSRFNNQYTHYQSALLHAASIFPSGKKEFSRVKEICDCIETKPPGQKYKARIGLSYVYYQVWYELADYPILMELSSAQRREAILNSPTFDIIEKAITHAKLAYEWLKINREKEEEKTFARTRKYYYIINNLLYFVTKVRSVNEFTSIETTELADSLENVIAEPNYWQPRFHDTLALYYFRKALLSTSENIFQNYMNNALEHNELSIKRIKGSARNYERLKRKIKAVELEGFDKITSGII